MRIPSGTTDQYIYFVAVDATDFTTRETGLSSFTVYRSRNGAAPAAMTTPTINQVSAANMPGVYELLLDEDMTIDSGNDSEEMVFHITHAGMAPVTRTIELYRAKITVGRTLTVASNGDLTEVNTLTGHTAQTGDNYARLGAPAGASVSADIAAIEAQTDDIGAAGAGLTAVPWNAAWDAEVQSEVQDAIVANHLDHLLATDYDPASKPGTATALLNELVESDAGISRFTANALEQAPSGGSAPTVSQIADAVWDEATSGHAAAGSAGKALTDAAAGGSGANAGSNEVTDITINDGTNPIEGAAVWITTDAAGNNTVWAGTTNASGEPLDSNGENPFLDPGTYYIWVQLGGYTFSNPTTKTVA